MTIKKGVKVDVFDSSKPGTAPYLGAAAIDGDPRQVASVKRAVLAEPSDILMLWDGERSGLVGGGLSGVVGSTVARLRPNGSVDLGFLRHALQAQFGWIQARRTGTGVPHVPKDLSTWLWLWLPRERSEQERIAEVLDSLDSQIATGKAIAAKLNLVRSGLLNDLMATGVGHSGRVSVAPLAALPNPGPAPGRTQPSGWKVGRLDEYARRGSGHTPNKNVPSYWNGGVKWVSLADSSRLDDLYIYETDKEISDAGIANSSAVKHPAGTVILSRDAGVGKSAILSEEMAVSQHFMTWQTGPELDNIFLYYWLQLMKPRFEAIAMGSTIKTIGLQYFRKLTIAVPPLPEQLLIARVLQEADQAIAATLADVAKLASLKVGLASAMLTGQVSPGPQVSR
ncbi:MAG: restriction endonuclease subunit S [Acidobacteria bacterium]|nr:restriction endonuclease subunit S [Acidobacteriota bacterium]